MTIEQPVPSVLNDTPFYKDNITDNSKKSILLMKIITIVSSIPITLNEKETTKVGEVTPIAT